MCPSLIVVLHVEVLFVVMLFLFLGVVVAVAIAVGFCLFVLCCVWFILNCTYKLNTLGNWNTHTHFFSYSRTYVRTMYALVNACVAHMNVCMEMDVRRFLCMSTCVSACINKYARALRVRYLHHLYNEWVRYIQLSRHFVTITIFVCY